MLALGDRLWWPTITDPMEDRPRWRGLLGQIGRTAPGTPMTGVLTTDPKPRLWPRMQAATAGAPGLYVHAPDYDWSRWTSFELRDVAAALAVVDEARALGAWGAGSPAQLPTILRLALRALTA
ncbi:hypothetical protein [Methylobacterium nodulans]|uniref:Uncharacterized protein n=1 Tax=Methylobacterium nodulans (strain LMG 21967 / CNCM I-2342 / ORS 2060) TaxID=460265 RepID=B8IQN7_METNO|nr:hypothetical protein [Methylobacterium nodulans]ACL60549.1 hypothetical protein Mnod_5719 [Methylobacterium nodulans ORS 2060]